MANQQNNPKGKKENDKNSVTKTRPNETETPRNTNDGYEGSSGSMFGNRRSGSTGDLNRDIETDRESSKDVGRTTGSKTEREH